MCVVLYTGNDIEELHSSSHTYNPCMFLGKFAIHGSNFCNGKQSFCLEHWMGHESSCCCLCCKFLILINKNIAIKLNNIYMIIIVLINWE